MVATSIPATSPEPVMIQRITRGNRHLWYRLEVVQQPERARACGAGPKSSADRRPVDPPPVVELRIFEGPSYEHSKDVTFTYNANFFLFATLEHARVIAHGRVQAPSAATPPVLTGMPVSGMPYLDRPQEAGYFLFPDLSVRHEGRYRLTFNLYEQTKETCDLDKQPSDYKTPAEMPESFDWRMEVKSNDFTVYSAKKFPGLTESTALSRTVAEQGCRVRIRRDVRMRRREGKSAAVAAAAAAAAAAVSGSSDREEEYRRRRTQTPEVVSEYRARSMSQESVNRTPYSTSDAARRPSMTDYHHAAPSPQAGPSISPAFGASSSAPAANANHLRFGAAPAPSFQTPSSVPPSPTCSTHASYAPPPPHHPASSYSTASSPSVSQPLSQSPYYTDRPASQHYNNRAPSPSARRESLASPVDYHRRMSAVSYGGPEPMDRRRDDMIQPRLIPETKTTLPPLSEMIAAFGNKEQQPRPPMNSNPHNHHHSSFSSGPSAAPTPVIGVDRVPSLSALLLPQPVLPLPNGALAGPPPMSQNKKRSFGQYNNLDAESEAYQLGVSMKNHARQSDAQLVAPHNEEELWWKRADGTVWSARGELQQQMA